MTLDLACTAFVNPLLQPCADPVRVAVKAKDGCERLAPAVADRVSHAVDGVPLHKTVGDAAIAELERVILATKASVAASSLDDLGSSALLSEIAGRQHETLRVRLFTS